MIPVSYNLRSLAVRKTTTAATAGGVALVVFVFSAAQMLAQGIERTLGKEAKKNFLPLQPGDVPETYADIAALERDVGFRPGTPLETGVKRFIEWYRQYYSK